MPIRPSVGLGQPRKALNVRLTVCCRMYDGPEEQRVCKLPVHPNMLVERDQPADERADDADRVP